MSQNPMGLHGMLRTGKVLPFLTLLRLCIFYKLCCNSSPLQFEPASYSHYIIHDVPNYLILSIRRLVNPRPEYLFPGMSVLC
jgi:hypothetical protein